uniref:Uncharacterized protein n=1 Tax=Pipistrellus kuhlii TaxID=59472 RepID=A0A7J7V0I2_PIPKU|nr:hypothetical protein mPipKuh1_008607 [Pipistrellus kuhlii]
MYWRPGARNLCTGSGRVFLSPACTLSNLGPLKRCLSTNPPGSGLNGQLDIPLTIQDYWLPIAGLPASLITPNYFPTSLINIYNNCSPAGPIAPNCPLLQPWLPPIALPCRLGPTAPPPPKCPHFRPGPPTPKKMPFPAGLIPCNCFPL